MALYGVEEFVPDFDTTFATMSWTCRSVARICAVSSPKVGCENIVSSQAPGMAPTPWHAPSRAPVAAAFTSVAPPERMTLRNADTNGVLCQK